MTSQRQPEEKQFAEEVGIFFEQTGMPRMAGRTLGWLMISDPPHQTTGELTEALQASKGSISTMTRYLIRIGIIERISLPGQRRDYFRIKVGAWHQMLKDSLAQITVFRQFTERGLELIEDKAHFNRQWLEEMRDMYAFFEREFPLLLDRWEQEFQKNRRQSGDGKK
ncbi:MAG: MarR family transcriptional regulator [Dehalococcoidales bacterium]